MADDERGAPTAADFVLRSVGRVLDRLAQTLCGPRDTDARKTADVCLRAAVSCLVTIHERQWELEALCRAGDARDDDLGRLKRAIDGSNARRVACINDIDDVISEGVPKTRPNALPWPLTIGQMIDTLVIAGLKVHRLPHRSGTVETFAHLMQSFEAMTGLVEAGSTNLPPASTIKDYRHED